MVRGRPSESSIASDMPKGGQSRSGRLSCTFQQVDQLVFGRLHHTVQQALAATIHRCGMHATTVVRMEGEDLPCSGLIRAFYASLRHLPHLLSLETRNAKRASPKGRLANFGAKISPVAGCVNPGGLSRDCRH